MELEPSNSWDKCPEEVILHIYGYLDVKDLLMSASVCKKWYRLTNDESLWKKMGLKVFNQIFEKNELTIKEQVINKLHFFPVHETKDLMSFTKKVLAYCFNKAKTSHKPQFCIIDQVGQEPIFQLRRLKMCKKFPSRVSLLDGDELKAVQLEVRVASSREREEIKKILKHGKFESRIDS